MTEVPEAALKREPGAWMTMPPGAHIHFSSGAKTEIEIFGDPRSGSTVALQCL
jgi:hypothetical protein